ncbi:MAG: cell division protein SepF [Lachnospiraceae bacterium]|nr:cell division protein SepF [Ruminococcus sp.]MCM1274698.1 cell division protein SepF [Lachnospiraceae bacterium]
MANFLKSIFGTGDENEGFVDYDEGYDTSSNAVTNEEAGYSSGYSDFHGSYGSGASSKVINMHSGAGMPKLFIMKPSGYDEVMNEAVDMLREGTIIFLNLNGIDQEIGTRIVDFMTGVAAAFEGRIKKVDTCCYAVAPKNVDWINNIDE